MADSCFEQHFELWSLCREVGIECREVSGHGKGAGYKLGQSYQNTDSNHQWNAVRLEDHWYLLDACWGAGVVDMDNKSYTQRYQIQITQRYCIPSRIYTVHCMTKSMWVSDYHSYCIQYMISKYPIPTPLALIEDQSPSLFLERFPLHFETRMRKSVPIHQKEHQWD